MPVQFKPYPQGAHIPRLLGFLGPKILLHKAFRAVLTLRVSHFLTRVCSLPAFWFLGGR